MNGNRLFTFFCVSFMLLLPSGCGSSESSPQGKQQGWQAAQTASKQAIEALKDDPDKPKSQTAAENLRQFNEEKARLSAIDLSACPKDFADSFRQCLQDYFAFGEKLLEIQAMAEKPGTDPHSPEIQAAFEKLNPLTFAIIDSELKLYELCEENGLEEIVTFLPENMSKVKKKTRTVRVGELYKITGVKAVRYRLAHPQAVMGIAFSPDNETLATACADGIVRLWSMKTGKTVAELKGHEAPVICLAFSRDGKRLFTAGGNCFDEASFGICHMRIGSMRFAGRAEGVKEGVDNGIRIWDVAKRREIKRLDGHESEINSIAVSPDGKRLLSCSARVGSPVKQDISLRLWNVDSGRCEILPHDNVVTRTAFSPDGRCCAYSGARNLLDRQEKLGPRDNSLTAWIADAQTGRPIYSLRTRRNLNMMLPAETYGLAFSPKGDMLLTGTLDGVFQGWNTADGSELWTTERIRKGGMMFGINDVEPDSANMRNPWKTEEGKDLFWPNSAILSIACSADGKQIAIGSTGNTADNIFDAAPMENEGPQGHNVQILDAATKRRIALIGNLDSHVFSIDYSPQSNLLALATFNGDVFVIGTADVEYLEYREVVEEVKEVMLFPVRTLAYSPDGSRLAVGGDADYVVELDPKTKKILGEYKGHRQAINKVAYAPDGQSLLSASDDQTVRIWDTATRREKYLFTGHDKRVLSAAFSADGRLIASGQSGNPTALLWNPADGTILQRLTATTENPEYGITGLAFHPNGKRIALACGSDDDRVGLPCLSFWELPAAKRLEELSDRIPRCAGFAWSPDGKKIASPSGQYRMSFFDAETGEAEVAYMSTGKAFVFSGDGAFAAGNAQTQIQLFDAKGESSTQTVPCNAATAVAFPPQGGPFAIGSHDGIVRFADDPQARE